MKYFSLLSLALVLLTACNTATPDGSTNTEESEELARLRFENRDLQGQLEEKDSMLNDAIMLFNEIEENLAMINLKDDEIRLHSNNVEMPEDGKQWILQE